MRTAEVRVATLLTLVVFAALVFTRLGHYALWDDEAETALFGRAVWATGDTSAVQGDNYVLYRDALWISPDLVNRGLAPLSFYIEAPFVRGSDDVWWARLPFALAGLATVWLVLRWIAGTQATRLTWALTILGLLGNVSFILYARQARYYTLTMLFATAIGYAYAHRGRSRSMLVWLSACGVLLCATHYLVYAAVAAAVATDYVVWGRKAAAVSRRAIVAIVASQIVLCLPVLMTWNPLGKDLTGQHSFDALGRVLLWLRTLRDMNNAELGVGLLVLVAPLLLRRSRDLVLVRLLVATGVSTLVVSAFSPQRLVEDLADIRYVAFLIPACILIAVRAIEALRLPAAGAMLAGVITFHTTLLHLPIERVFSSPRYQLPVRSTLASYLGELVDPPVSAYGMTAEWLRVHVPAGDTVLVFPDFATYPLMFHAPHVTYAWQLSEERAAAFSSLPPIHTRGKVPPDWVVAIDNRAISRRLLAQLQALGADYTRVASLPATGVDGSRAELFWHRFDARDAYLPTAPIAIWRRSSE
jgi:hypothetical protein